MFRSRVTGSCKLTITGIRSLWDSFRHSRREESGHTHFPTFWLSLRMDKLGICKINELGTQQRLFTEVFGEKLSGLTMERVG